MVREVGFEPTATRFQSEDSVPAELLPDIELVAPGRVELPLNGISARCLCQLGYGATYNLERPAFAKASAGQARRQMRGRSENLVLRVRIERTPFPASTGRSTF